MKSLSAKLYEEQNKRPTYTPTAEDRIKLNRIETDFNDMIRSRQVIDKDWKIYQTMIDAVPKNYQDDRSSSTVPLASAIIELFVAKASKIQTQFIVKGENNKYLKSARIRQNVWDYDWRTNNRKEEIIDNEYTTAWFWRSVIRTWFEVDYIKQYELEEIKENWEMTRSKKEIKDEKIILENIDIRNFYLDNNTTRWIKTAKKCMLRKWIGYDEFLDLKNNKLYKNIEYVRPQNYTSTYMPYTTSEEASRDGKFVEIREYRNLNEDIYCVWANGVIIREHHIISTVKGRKCLPFTTRVLGKKINRYDTGRWLCEALLRFNSELNDLREMLMDGIRRSNNPTIAIGNWLTFNGRKFSFDNEVLEFDWDLNTWFRELSWTPPNQAIFEYMNRLFEHIAIFVGIDIKNILWVPQQTAYQTNVQVEASQERVNVWLTNRDLAFERMANQHMENLVRFFPRETAEWISPEIEIKDYEVVEEETEYWIKQSIVRKKGVSGLLRITPELLEWETYVDVYTNISRPPSDIANRQSKLEFAQSLWAIIWAYANAKSVGVDMSFIPIESMIKELANEYNLESVMESTPDEDIVKQSAEFKEKLMAMKESLLWWQIEPGWWQAPQPVEPPQEWQALAPNPLSIWQIQ